MAEVTTGLLIAVADTGNHRILVLDQSGHVQVSLFRENGEQKLDQIHVSVHAVESKFLFNQDFIVKLG